MGRLNTALFVCSVPLPTQPTPSIDPRVRFTNLVNWWYCDGETRTLLFVCTFVVSSLLHVWVQRVPVGRSGACFDCCHRVRAHVQNTRTIFLMHAGGRTGKRVVPRQRLPLHVGDDEVL